MRPNSRQYSARNLGIVALTCLLAVSTGAHSLVHAAQPPAQRVRTIPRTTKPIAQRLLPDDEVVVIDEIQERTVFDGEPTPALVIRHAMLGSVAVAIVRVDEVLGVLADGGTWIDTRAVGQVERLLIPDKKEILTKDRLQFETAGGEMMIGKVLVRAGKSLGVQPGSRYLMFFTKHDGSLYPEYMPLRIDGDTVVNPWQLEPGSTTKDPLHGLKLAEITKQIRRLAKQR